VDSRPSTWLGRHRRSGVRKSQVGEGSDGLASRGRACRRGEWGTPKSRRSSRAVPLVDRAAAELERHFQCSAYRADDDLVFCHPHTGKPYDASRLRKRFYEAMSVAGLGCRCGREGGITFHSLRHTFGTRMAAVGVPMRTLQEWMGHRDYTTTLVYADFAPDPAGGAALAARAFGLDSSTRASGAESIVWSNRQEREIRQSIRACTAARARLRLGVVRFSTRLCGEPVAKPGPRGLAEDV